MKIKTLISADLQKKNGKSQTDCQIGKPNNNTVSRDGEKDKRKEDKNEGDQKSVDGGEKTSEETRGCETE